ncbi:MAG TPA: thiamine pyrophosphate-dependent dehydrogenase E1 component subunit alpha [Candidatus Eisenbacteria bacterium]|nr:thiamine pyrophosphate-dependent dehydrogenase E1 component subunit alpha [Candidatus Eisenbacteria bacterium]
MTDRLSILTPDGKLVDGAKQSMTDTALIEALRWMLMSRIYDERATALQRQGLYGVFSPALGQEASVVGSTMALDPARDWIVPQYRELVALVRHGYPLERLAAVGMGRVTEAARIPDGVNVLPNQVALATQLPHATGLAWGLKLQKKDSVVMTYVGDGGSSEGDFHEGLNLAGVQRAPVVFFLSNNQWAISTPRRVQSATPSFALRAAGYGFPGVEVDGNDVLAVYSAASEAVERARAGEGPTLIESVTYRMSFHNTTDNPSLYEDPKQRDDASRRDPIDRVVRYLTRRALWDKERDKETRASVRAEVDAALEKAAAFPVVTPNQLFDHIYSELPERLRRQREELSSDGSQA